jgi:hypothetical protein
MPNPPKKPEPTQPKKPIPAQPAKPAVDVAKRSLSYQEQMQLEEEERRKRAKAQKRGDFGFRDAFLGIFGFLAMVALAIAGFKVAKWVVQTYFK